MLSLAHLKFLIYLHI